MNLKEDMDALDAKLNQLKVDYEQYFAKNLKREPCQLRQEVDRIILKYSGQPIQNTALKFRYSTLTAKYTSLRHYWDRILRQIEEGTYERGSHHTNIAGTPSASRQETLQQEVKLEQQKPSLGIDGRFLSLYQEYIEKRKQYNESVNGLTLEKFTKPLLEQTEKVKDSYKCSDVEYKVTVKEGKTKLIIVPKK